MPNRDNRYTPSHSRPHTQHPHTPAHPSTRHSAHHSSPVIRELHRPPRDYRTQPMELGRRHYDEHSDRHSATHHSSPIMR